MAQQVDLSNLPDKAIDLSNLPDKAVDLSSLPDKGEKKLGPIDSFISARLNQLSGEKPGILNPNPDQNPLINKPFLPELQHPANEGYLGWGLRGLYNQLIRPIASPLGLLGSTMGSNPAEYEPLNKTLSLNEDIPLKAEAPVTAPKPEPKLLGPAKSIQLPESKNTLTPSQDQPFLGTGKPAELLHPNLMAPASEILNPEVTPKPIAEAAKSQDPIIQAAANDVAQSGWLDKIKNRKDPVTIASEELLNRQGTAGQIIAQKLDRASLKERMYLADAKNNSPTALSLSPEDFSKAVDIVEGNETKGSPEVIQAASEISSNLKNLGQKMENTNVSLKNLKGESVPFKMREDYFPHSYPPDFLDQPDILDRLVKGGMSRDDALDLLQSRRKYGELLTPFQHQRIPADLPGYLKTQESYENYLNKASRRIAMAEELGPEDINGKQLGDLIEQTKDPTYTTKLLRRMIPGRDDPNSLTETAFGKANNLATKLMAYAHLSRYAISRMAPATEMVLRGNIGSMIGEMTKVLTNAGYAKDLQSGTGVIENISNYMLDAINKYPTSGLLRKVFIPGSEATDSFMRTVSAGMGKGLATDLFEKLKKNPFDQRSVARLNNLVMENIGDVLKQKELTPQQLNMAGAKFSEMTQGLPEARKVPLAFSEPLLQIPLIMKKYAFQHGKMLKDAILENPARNIPLALALTQIFGEGIGDVKAGLKGATVGAVTGDNPLDTASEDIANRGGFETSMIKKMGLGDHPLIGRLADNLTNAWIPFEIEILQSLSDSSGLAKAIGGPLISDASSLIGGKLKTLERYPIANAPVVGSSELARKVVP